jgi:hypothetical protein
MLCTASAIADHVGAQPFCEKTDLGYRRSENDWDSLTK